MAANPSPDTPHTVKAAVRQTVFMHFAVPQVRREGAADCRVS